ncbi:uncharacterized protein BO66DRAFT_401376 [Aspergillus aculeatinus CBS 121060]|uniref:Uncharacterized protein n=1 Tax=Aspergillus aculeatinus CBS 121060 TaxID=1448322 RepID=A0ACD1H9V4_9EURO|nr:hypothetical protein BO66DRAFT_401376 [Aspergillus aculeatinus CBS 121060]RAH70332.1 hypothetical protein BO66DRAFT_401376 [Aspergillus aculeatinus CBS 121060]
MKLTLALLYSAALLFDTSRATQFQNFYPFYRTTLTTERPDCHAYYNASLAARNTSDPNTCKHMAECLLEGAGEVNKGDWASATVLLGLTPSILGTVAPTIEERLQLLRERPILGFLGILAAPSLTFARPWVKPDHPGDKPTTWLREHTAGRNPNVYRSLVQYLAVALAAANVLENAIRLGSQTIISWKCNMGFLELAWVLLAPVPSLVMLVLPPLVALTNSGLAVLGDCLGRLLSREHPDTTAGTPANDHDGRVDLGEGFYNGLANICGLVHVVYGTIVLSSVQFIGTLDALGVVGRFTASALVAQFITMTQLYGGSGTKEKRNEGKKKQDGSPWLDRTGVTSRVYGLEGDDRSSTQTPSNDQKGADVEDPV